MKVMILIALSLVCASAFAASKVAVVKLMRGDASVLTLGKTTPLKVDDWVEDGAVVKTADKSFVKLIFVDKSSMNVGPNSEMKIESFSGKDSGVIDLVKGKIRSQVTKDYLQINKDKSKLFIKTQNAVMGVRGTDFMISTNGVDTSTVLFEGEIVFNKLDNRREMNTNRLEEIVDRGVRIYPGEFSVMEQNRPQPTIPAILNIQQLEKMEKNKEFDSSRTPSNTTTSEAGKSVVPAGLNGQQVSNTSSILKTEVAQIAADSQTKVSPAIENPEGYVKGDAYKPTNGSSLDGEKIVPPAPGSPFDDNSKTFIDGQNNLKLTETGDVMTPQVQPSNGGNGQSTPVVVNPPTDGKQKLMDVNAPVPSKAPLTPPDVQITAGPMPAGTPDMQIRPGNDIFNRPDVRPNIVGGGIVTGGSVAPGAGAVSPTTDTTIIIKP